MRKKRKARAVAEEKNVLEADLELPEVKEALEAERQVAAAEEAEREAAKALVDGEEVLAEAEGEKLTQSRITSIVESYLLASDRALTVADIHKLMGSRTVPRTAIERGLDELRAAYADRGIVVHHIAGAYQLRTHPSNGVWVQRLVAGKPIRLSRAQLETLAICAYRQPITRPEIDEIRGVDSGNTLRILLDRGLIRILGKKEEPGRPLLYGTTKEFLEFFNLGDLAELPTLREFSELSEDSIAEVERLGHTVDEGTVQSAISDDDNDDGSNSGSNGGGSEGGPAGGDSSVDGSASTAADIGEMAASGGFQPDEWGDPSDLVAAAEDVGLGESEEELELESDVPAEDAVPTEILAEGSAGVPIGEPVAVSAPADEPVLESADDVSVDLAADEPADDEPTASA